MQASAVYEAYFESYPFVALLFAPSSECLISGTWGPWDFVTTHNWDSNPILIEVTPIGPFKGIILKAISPSYKP